MSTKSQIPLEEQLSQLFGSYKAEWLKEQLFELFTEPAYFPELTTTRSCILEGGRGTGKTTVLRGLSYKGQFALRKGKPGKIEDWRWYGLYYRVNTNHVTAFSGELTEEEWIPLFAHYMNLLLCDLILEFLEWYELKTGSTVVIDKKNAARLAMALHLEPCTTHHEIRDKLADSRIQFEAYVNNVVDAERPRLSMQSAPLDQLCKLIQSLEPFAGTQFFILLDEYENLLNYQQQVVNTLIKHASDAYCFKIGVRELGRRCRSTLNENEQLIHPADYARINISEKLQGSTFRNFALNVCQARLARIQLDGQPTVIDLEDAFAGLSEEDEAKELGVEVASKKIKTSLLQSCQAEQRAFVEQRTALELYFLDFWATTKEFTKQMALDEATANPAKWKERFGNYKHALLFTLRRGKRGIRKYYCGWDTFTLMAAGNIRYVLELVDQSLLAQFQQEGSLKPPISPKIQTVVAQRVGNMNLSELEGLSVDGAQLTKFLLSLGRVFQVMASDAIGHAPEVNQFQVSAGKDTTSRDSSTEPVERILTSAVMHLALLRSLGNKPGDVGDTKDYDYMMHPIYSALFEFSARRKRKMTLSQNEVLGLIRRPKETIREVLRANNRSLETKIPEQLTLFERFYDADSQ